MTIFLLYNNYEGDKMKKINNKGFTLIEILAVISIIALLTVVAGPSVLGIINTAKNKTQQVLIDNVKIAGQQLFDELENTNSELYNYSTKEGKLGDTITIETERDDNEKTRKIIRVNYQTLVSNGFLAGTNNEDIDTNPNKKIILDTKSKVDMGLCEIKIIKEIDKTKNYKTTYRIESNSTEEICPTTEEYNK